MPISLQSLQSSCRTEPVIWSWSTFQTLCFPPGSSVPQQAHLLPCAKTILLKSARDTVLTFRDGLLLCLDQLQRAFTRALVHSLHSEWRSLGLPPLRPACKICLYFFLTTDTALFHLHVSFLMYQSTKKASLMRLKVSTNGGCSKSHRGGLYSC